MCVSVCVSMCLLVSAIPSEPFDVQTQNLVEGFTLTISLTLTISRMSSKVKVIGQRSRSLGGKNVTFGFSYGLTCSGSLCCHMTSQHDVT